MTIRDNLLNFASPENAPFETGNGIVYIKRPTVKVRAEIISAGKAHTKNPDLAKMTALAIIRCTVDDKGAQVFQPADMAALLDAPVGTWVDDLGAEIMKMLTPNQDEIAENLDETATDN